MPESLQYRIRDLCSKLLNGTRTQRIKGEETADEDALGIRVDFFHLDCLASEVRLNVDLDVALTELAAVR